MHSLFVRHLPVVTVNDDVLSQRPSTLGHEFIVRMPAARCKGQRRRTLPKCETQGHDFEIVRHLAVVTVNGDVLSVPERTSFCQDSVLMVKSLLRDTVN